MKEYRIKPEFIKSILIGRLKQFMVVTLLMWVVSLCYLRYLHPRIGPFESWSEFFTSEAIIISFSILIAMTIFFGVWGFVTGNEFYRTLVITIDPDCITWRTSSTSEKFILYSDMIKITDGSGFKVKSRVNRNLILNVPSQIDSFEELSDAINDKMNSVSSIE